jgi:hypothetical protein
MKTIFNWIGAALLLTMSAQAAPIQWTVGSGGNDHWYDFVTTSVTAGTARTNSLASTFLGMPGYLVTITSAAENNFVASILNGSAAWGGGSDAAVEGVWRWIDGPEAGLIFWNGGVGGSSPNYAGWEGNEPNNLNDEDHLHLNYNPGQWNDLNAGNFLPYVIEYSSTAVPEPGTITLLGFALAGLGIARRRK